MIVDAETLSQQVIEAAVTDFLQWVKEESRGQLNGVTR